MLYKCLQYKIPRSWHPYKHDSCSGRALEQILQQINDVNAQIHQVATAAEEQTATTSEISKNMQQITEVVAKTSRGAKDSASAANHLSVLAEDLRQIVSQFKID